MDSNPDPLTKWVIFKEDKVCLSWSVHEIALDKRWSDNGVWKTENGLEPGVVMAKLRLNNGLKSIDKVFSN